MSPPRQLLIIFIDIIKCTGCQGIIIIGLEFICAERDRDSSASNTSALIWVCSIRIALEGHT